VQATETPPDSDKKPVKFFLGLRLCSVGLLSAQVLAAMLASSPWALLRIGNVSSPSALQGLALVLSFAAAQILVDLFGVLRALVWAAPVVQGIGVALLMLPADSSDPKERTTADVMTILGGALFLIPIPVLVGAAAEGLSGITTWMELKDEIREEANNLRRAASCACLAIPKETASAGVPEIIRILKFMVCAWFFIFVLLILEWLSLIPLPVLYTLVPLLSIASLGLGHWATSVCSTPQSVAWGPPRRSRAGPMVLAPVTVLIAIAGLLRLTLQASSTHVPYDGTLTVIDWNVMRGMEVNLVTGLTANLFDIGIALRTHKADIVGLQESHVLSPITGGRDVPTLIAGAWGTSLSDCYGSSPRNSPFSGTAQFTPHSFTKCGGQNLPGAWPMSSMAMSETVVQLNSTFSVTVFSVHPILGPRSLNRAQISFFVQRAKLVQGPMIIMGDWNAAMDNWSANRGEVKDTWHDALMQIWEIEGLRHAFNPSNDTSYEWPITRPSSRSRIDHVFYRGLPEPISAELMVDNFYSDHHALKMVWRP